MHNKTNMEIFCLNMCRRGKIYFKSMQFYTTAPIFWSELMELKCNHSFRHPPCVGGDDENSSFGQEGSLS